MMTLEDSVGGGGGAAGPYEYCHYAAGGSFGGAGSLYSGNCLARPRNTYGSAKISPLIGGSGGGGSAGGWNGGANLGYGGGGGALQLASSGTINILGSITADGGNGYYDSTGGSGGAIKLIANIVVGSGVISAYNGGFPYGGVGRIRIEAYTNNFASTTTPSYTYGLPGNIFIANTPSLSITSIGGVSVSSNPTASYSTPDIALPDTTTNPVTVMLSASNIPLSATITVSVRPQYGAVTNVTTTLSGTDASSTATASVNLSSAFASVIMAYTTYTLQTAMYYEVEKIDKVRVASSIGKRASAVYITESGKEIPATLLAGLLK